MMLLFVTLDAWQAMSQESPKLELDMSTTLLWDSCSDSFRFRHNSRNQALNFSYGITLSHFFETSHSSVFQKCIIQLFDTEEIILIY